MKGFSYQNLYPSCSAPPQPSVKSIYMCCAAHTASASAQCIGPVIRAWGFQEGIHGSGQQVCT